MPSDARFSSYERCERTVEGIRCEKGDGHVSLHAARTLIDERAPRPGVTKKTIVEYVWTDEEISPPAKGQS